MKWKRKTPLDLRPWRTVIILVSFYLMYVGISLIVNCISQLIRFGNIMWER